MDLPEGNPDVEVVYLATYKKFMEAIDAIDNGEPPLYMVRKHFEKSFHAKWPPDMSQGHQSSHLTHILSKLTYIHQRLRHSVWSL